MNEAVGPLHLLPPLTSMILWLLLLVTGFLIGLWVLLYLFNKYRNRPQPLVLDKFPATVTIQQKYNAIYQQAMETSDYRSGLHLLSDSVREHLSKTLWLPFLTSVIQEMKKSVYGEYTIVQFFERIDTMRFRAKAPTKAEFIKLMDQANQFIRRRTPLERIKGL